ncbi:hypothetical protein H0H93_008277, partial [Arthromyces matolae]
MPQLWKANITFGTSRIGYELGSVQMLARASELLPKGTYIAVLASFGLDQEEGPVPIQDLKNFVSFLSELEWRVNIRRGQETKALDV